MQAPESIQGKKIKCKGCGEVFAALPVPAKTKAEPPNAKPAASGADKAKGKGNEEEWGVVKAYGVTSEDLSPRCPFCAAELEDDQQVVCLECGYNLQTRERLQEKILEPVTGGDYFLWLLPGILCALFGLFFFGLVILGVVFLIAPPEGYEGDSWFRMSIIYGAVFNGFIAFFTIRGAIKRLILNPHPPDKEKVLKKDEGK